MPGFERGRNLEKVGMKAQDTAELFFDEVRVPARNLVGARGRRLRAPHGEPAAGAAVDRRRARSPRRSTVFELTLQYCKDRTAFGQPIGAFQHNRFVLAEMATELELARTYVDKAVLEHNARPLHRAGRRDGQVVDHRAAEAGGRPRACSCTAATATCSSTRSPRRSSTRRVQTIYGGTTEVMKEIIGRSLGV